MRHSRESSNKNPDGPTVERILHSSSPVGLSVDVTFGPDGKALEIFHKGVRGDKPLRPVKVKINGGACVEFAVPSVCGGALRCFFSNGGEAVINTVTGRRWEGSLPRFVLE